MTDRSELELEWLRLRLQVAAADAERTRLEMACARGGAAMAEPLYRGSLREELRKLDEVAR